MNMPQMQLDTLPLETTQAAIQTTTIDFLANDGYMLTGILYTPKTVKSRIVVACATGVPQPFYRRFAEFSAAQGFEVLTFDYRGIHLSAPKQLKDFQMSYLDWGEHDLTGAIDRLKSDNLPLFMVGHSYGGQALGLTRNHHKVSAMYCYGTGAGWHGWMPLPERLKVQFMWNVVFPVFVAWKGYLPWKMLGMGEDMPIDVYRSWKRWCGMPHYFFDDPLVRESKKLQFAQISTPITAAVALDDLWALPVSRDAFMQYYSAAEVTHRDLDPQAYNLKFGAIGHMGYFRPLAQPLWDEILAWFAEPLTAK